MSHLNTSLNSSCKLNCGTLSRMPQYLHLTAKGWVRDAYDRVGELAPIVNTESLVTEIIYGSTLNSTSILENITCIPPGVSFKEVSEGREPKLRSYIDWNSLDCYSDDLDPASILCEFVSGVVLSSQSGRYFVVRLTGGLDSTGILLSLLECVSVERVLAVTYVSSISSCGADEFAAKELCKKYGVKLILLEMEPRLLLNEVGEKLPPLLNMRYAAHDFYKKERTTIADATHDDYDVFDGHGGDHVFCEVVPTFIVSELLLSLRPIKAIGALIQLSRYHGCSISSTLMQDRARKKNIRKQALRYFKAEAVAVKEVECQSLQQYRREILQEAIIENGKSSATDILSNVHFPFTCKKMIKCGVDLKIEDSFGGVQKRIQYRQSILRRHGVSLTRSAKGHVTGAYQAAVSIKKNKLLSLIKNGELFKRGLVHLPSIEYDLDLCAKGVGGFNVLLLRLITAELMLQGYRING